MKGIVYTYNLLFLFCYFTCTIEAQDRTVLCVPPVVSSLLSWTDLFGTSPSSTITIANGVHVLLDASSVTIQNGGIVVEEGGSLYFDWQRSIQLNTDYILVNGALHIGSETCPFENKAVITLTNNADENLSFEDRIIGTKVLAIGSNGVLELHGAKGLGDDISWTFLAENAPKDGTIIKLAADVAGEDSPFLWAVGNQLVVATTDFSPLQTEVVTIKSIIDSRTVELESPLAYPHFGEITFGVDERAEVGLLTRNILIQGTIDPEDPSFGGHFVVQEGFTAARVEGVEFFNMGQDKIGRYPVHFHNLGLLPANTYIKFNSVHKSHFRCYALHGLQGMLMQSNIGYDALGHCYYLEDGVEENNTLYRNLAILTKPKITGERLGSDGDDGISSFWITNPYNNFTANVAAGSRGTGFWVHTRTGPRADAYGNPLYNGLVPRNRPLYYFGYNRGHGLDMAFQIEATNFDDGDVPQNIGAGMGGYEPKNGLGQRVPVYIEHFIAYKCRDRAIWARVEDIYVQNSQFGDNYVGVELATSGAHPPFPSVQIIEDCLFVGKSNNNGSNVQDTYQQWNNGLQASFPRKGEGFMGWREYDGAQGARRCLFRNYFNVDSRVHAAIGVRLANHGQVTVENFIESSLFMNVDRKIYFIDVQEDGGRGSNLHDRDGSITGFANSTILPVFTNFFSTENCNSSSLFGITCPHRYAHLWIIDNANQNVNNRVTLTRNLRNSDQHSDYQLSLKGFSDSNRWRYQPIVSPIYGSSYLVSFENFVSPSIAFQLTNAHQGDSVTLAICFPSGSTINNVYRGFANLNGAGGVPQLHGNSDSIAISAGSSRNDQNVLDGSSYYFDSSRGLLFITVKQRNERSGSRFFCPLNGCDYIWVSSNPGTGSRTCMDEAYGNSDSLLVNSPHPWIDMQLTTSSGPDPIFTTGSGSVFTSSSVSSGGVSGVSTTGSSTTSSGSAPSTTSSSTSPSTTSATVTIVTENGSTEDPIEEFESSASEITSFALPIVIAATIFIDLITLLSFVM